MVLSEHNKAETIKKRFLDKTLDNIDYSLFLSAINITQKTL